MKNSTKFVLITAFGIAVGDPIKRGVDYGSPSCLSWIGTAPACDFVPTGCPEGYRSIASQDALSLENKCSSGTKYLCRKGNIHFLYRKFNISLEGSDCVNSTPEYCQLDENTHESICICISNGNCDVS